MSVDAEAAHAVLAGDLPPPCPGGRHYARAVRTVEGKVWHCVLCRRDLRPFHPTTMEDEVSKLPLSDQQVHEIAEAVISELMPRFEQALEAAFRDGRRSAFAEAEQIVRREVAR